MIPGRPAYASRTYIALVAIAIVIACSVAMAVYTHNQGITLRNAQVAACRRGNLLRRESNRRIQAHITDRDNLVRFARAARLVRVEAYRSGHQRLDLDAARAYARIIRAEARIRFDPVAIVDCQRAIPQP